LLIKKVQLFNRAQKASKKERLVVCCLSNADTHRNSSREIKANTNSTLILTLTLTLSSGCRRKEGQAAQKIQARNGIVVFFCLLGPL
jgi:hypothetical protein